MAERRMFSKRLTSSARFLKMPPSTQCLYFHLGLDADDDGVVDAFTTMRKVGATEDDLRILVGKSYVTVLNEDYVAYINDWNENNKIRADRKVDSIYKGLLLQIKPDAILLEKKPRADVKPKEIESMDNPVRDTGRPEDRIGKDRLGKESIGNKNIVYARPETEDANAPMKQPKTPYALFDRLWSRYPVKKGKGQVSEGKKKALMSIGEEELIRAIERYEAELEKDKDWRKPQNGSTFFNSGYIDYLDANYVPGQNKASRPPAKPNAFHNFPQRTDYDFDDLEQRLINKANGITREDAK